MKKPKLLKYPRKPKATASVSSLENYLHKVKEVDKENARKISEHKKATSLKATLKKKVASIGKAKGYK